MCGIFGRIDFSHNPIEWTPSDKFISIMGHRGPDDFGYKVIANGARTLLAHNRLSIIDLSEKGRQPLSNEDNTIWITFNGEIYNYQDLRKDLLKKGHFFKSNTDTEVIIHLYEEYGIDLLSKINGMFAFGLWDDKRKRLILARDRLGVKPLVYFINNNNKICVFASEIKALRYHDGIQCQLDWEAVELFFSFNFIPSPWTIFKNIKKLSPAHYLIFEKGRIRTGKYWDVPKVDSIISDFDEACVRIRDVVSEATRDRMRSDVPLGAFLSGGIDSSIVVANMARNSSSRIKTYFLGYENDDLFDETPYARAVADMYGTDHHEMRLSQSDIISIIPQVLSSFDEPFADSSVLPTYVVSREIRKNVTVALSGDGGDEIFGGYRRYLGEIYVNLYLKLPKLIREGLIAPFINTLPDSKGNNWLEILRRAKIFINGISNIKSEQHYSWMALFPERERKRVLSANVLCRFREIGKKCIADIKDGVGNDSINRALYRDFAFLLPNDMLNKVDWMSMQNSLEVRSPLLDYRVAELGFNLPGHFKVKQNELKYILRYAFRNWLPKLLLRRRKQGFEVPIGEWFKREEKFINIFWELVSSKKQYFNIQGVENIVSEHLCNRQDHSHQLWAILVFCWWLNGDYGISPL